MSRRNNHQKVEEKSMDYLEDLVNTSITQSIEEEKTLIINEATSITAYN